jgi:hypothetical protein
VKTDSDGLKLDSSVAHPARWYSYWLGGKDHFAADREFGDAVRERFPGIVATAKENRRFLQRLVAHLAREHGIGQFLDIGTGLPTVNNTHEVAQRIDPAARIVYVDNDPMVLVHARALLTSTPQGATAYAEADLREPEVILHSAQVTETLDLGRPVGLLLIAVLHFLSDDVDPHAIVARLAAGLASGSFVAITHGTFDGMDASQRAALDDLRSAGKYPFHPRGHKHIVPFFDGLDLLDPGVVNVVEWRPDDKPAPSHPRAEVAGYGGLARIP